MDEIEEVRSKVDLVALISEHLPLKKAGRNFKACCPFHAEKTPSFMVNSERQIWKCFGCQKGGDVFKYVMETERLEFGEALRLLAKRAGVALTGYRPSKNESEKDKLYQINHLASEYFHYLLLSHKIGQRALNYILQRGITKESLEKFKIGYSPAGWAELQKYLAGKKGHSLRDLESAGLIIPASHVSSSRYYDRFRDRLMFPLLDHRGNVCGFSGRVLDPTIKEAKYVNTPETLIYHKSELLYPLQITKEDIKKENSAVVVEGELDAISSYQVEIKNVVAIKGSALTEAQARLLKRFCETLLLSLDADAAGDMAARRGIEIADSFGFNLKVVTLEKYKDPDEAAQKEPDYLRERVAGAENVYDFYLESAFKRFRGKTPEEKKKIGQELVPVWAKIGDEIVKDLYTQKLAQRLGVNEEAIILQMRKKPVTTPGAKSMSDDKKELRDKKEILEEYLLALLFQSKKISLLADEVADLLSQPVYRKLAGMAMDYCRGNKFSSQFFAQSLPAELTEAFDKLYLVDFGERLGDDDWVLSEFKKIRIRLETTTVKDELQRICQGLKANQSEPEAQDQEKIRMLTQKLAGLEKKML